MTRVLVLDSDGFACTGLRIQLADHGFDVVSAPDMSTGLELVRTQRLAAVILELSVPADPGHDPRRPRANAFTVIPALRQVAPDLGIILLTHDADQLDGFLQLMRAGRRGLAYKLKGLRPEPLAQTLHRVMAGQCEIDPGIVGQTHDLGEHLLRRLTPDENPWVERALRALDQLTPQETRAMRLMATSHNLAGIAHHLSIQRADTLVGRVYVKLGLDDMPQQAVHLRQNAILIKACQIHECRLALGPSA